MWGTYLATWGAMALQGPHHVAKASMMTTGLAAMVSRNSWSLRGGDLLADCLDKARLLPNSFLVSEWEERGIGGGRSWVRLTRRCCGRSCWASWW